MRMRTGKKVSTKNFTSPVSTKKTRKKGVVRDGSP